MTAAVDRIALSGIEVFAYHGVLPHERERGQPFVVDVVLDIDLAPAAASDRLEDTVDYGSLARDIQDLAAGDPCNLIETVADRIAARCLDDPRVAGVEVTVTKPHAPLPVVARDVSVTVRRTRGGAA